MEMKARTYKYDMVFIGGVGRSGTSITRELLGTKDDALVFPFEYRFIIDPDGIVDFINSSCASWSPFIYDKNLRRLEKFLMNLSKPRKAKLLAGNLIRSSQLLKRNITVSPYHNWNLSYYFKNYNEAVAILIKNLSQFKYDGSWIGSDSFCRNSAIYYSGKPSRKNLQEIFREFLAEIFNDIMKRSNKTLLIEDNTWNLLFLQELSELFPSAKFIHVYRDPRDVVSSYMKQRWMPSNAKESAIICRDLYERIIYNIKKNARCNVFEISIEELVNNKEESLRKVYSFLKLEIPEEAIEFELSSASFGRWKKDLSQNEINEITPVLKGVMDYYHYL